MSSDTSKCLHSIFSKIKREKNGVCREDNPVGLTHGAPLTCGLVFESGSAHLYSGRVERNVSVLRRSHQHHVLEELEP